MNKEIYDLLKDKKRLKEESLFIIDTEKILDEVIKNKLSIKYFLYSEKRNDLLKKHDELKNIAKQIKESYIKRFSLVESHQGFLAIVKAPDNKIKNFNRLNKLVLLDTIQDPSNLGVIIRNGIAFNFRNFLFLNCVYLFNEKSIRASAGSVFLCNYYEIDKKEIQNLKQEFQIITTSLKDGSDLKKIKSKIKDKFVIILGNEGRGVDNEIEKISDLKIKIEHSTNVESLNVGSASAIIFYELNQK